MQQLIEQLLHDCFSVAPGDADYRYLKSFAMVGSQRLHRREHVGNHQEVGIRHHARFGRLMVDDKAAYAQAVKLEEIAMAVIRSGFQCKEEGSLRKGEHTAIDEQALNDAVVQCAMGGTNDLSDLLNGVLHYK